MPKLTIVGWREGLLKISMVHALQDHLSLSMTEAKATVDAIVAGETVSFALNDSIDPSAVRDELERVGAVVMSTSDPFDVEHEPWDVTFVRDQLHFAAQDGNQEEVQRLLAAGYELNRFDEIGKTPLHYAAMEGHVTVMNVLLVAGADVNAHDETVIGNTPLREVARNCSYEVAKILVDAGADPTIPGWMLITALHDARERREPEGLRVCELLENAAARLGHGAT